MSFGNSKTKQLTALRHDVCDVNVFNVLHKIIPVSCFLRSRCVLSQPFVQSEILIENNQ